MRTRVALIFICCAIFISCEPIDEYDDCFWQIKNNTTKSIVFDTVTDRNIESYEIAMGDSVTIQRKAFSNNEIPFNYGLNHRDSVMVSFTTGEIRQIWRKHDDKSGRHFYNRSSWFFYKTFRKKGFENYNFTFIIEESDLD